MPCSGARAPRSVGTHPPQKVPTFANYLVLGGAAVDGAPGTFPQVILTRHPDLHGLGAEVLQPQYSCRAHAGEFGKRPHTRIGLRAWTQGRLAETAHLDRSYLAGIESAKRDPSLRSLIKIANAFGIHISQSVAV